MGLVININSKEDLAKPYASGHQKLVVLEFMVPWSELCKFMSPAVGELANKYENNADFYTLDTDKFKDHAREKGVEVLPTFLLLKDGKECKRIVGINKEELDTSIDEHKGVAPSDVHPTTQAAPPGYASTGYAAPVLEAPSVMGAPFMGSSAMPYSRRRRGPFMPRGRRTRYPGFFSGWGHY